MLHFWLIADLEGKTSEQCRQWVDGQETYCKDYCKEHYSSLLYDCHSWFIPPAIGSEIRDAYHVIADLLGDAIGKATPSDRFVAILDARRKSNLQEISSLHSVQGLLILAFPDVLWIPVFKGEEKASEKAIPAALDLAAGEFNPMFDGTGVRGELMRFHRPNSVYPYNRNDVAVSIDEERHFAELTAYTAFRFGYRAYSVSTDRLARQVIGIDAKERLPSLAGARVSPEASLVVLEDRDVEFPDVDQTQNKRHRFGGGREEVWPLLKEANYRVLATAAGAEETIDGPCKRVKSDDKLTTVGEWFREKGFIAIGNGKQETWMRFVEKFCRLTLNLFAGGMWYIWAWNVIKGLLVVGILWELLVHCPIMLIPSLFLGIAVFGVFRNAIVRGLLLLFGHHEPIRRLFKIRDQWRFYPKLYPSHCPLRKVQRKSAKYWCHVRKPFGGMFELRNQCGLPNGRGFDGLLNKQNVKDVYKNALSGRAPTVTGGALEDSSHAAYGMTLDISTDLIRRARALKDRGGGIEDALHAAVLATCAYELLGHKTPALSIEALGLRHYCEVMAECEFPGVRARLDVEDRLVDIHNSLSQICRASNGAVREEMFENGMAVICDNLSELLRSRGRYEETAFLSRQSRYMHRLLLPPFLRSLLAFPEWAVRSKINFFTSLTIFLGVFAIYYKIRIDTGADFSDVLAKMYELLFSTQPNMDLTEIMATAKPRDVKTVVEISESLQLAVFNVDPELKARISSATVVVQAMRQLALIHIGFLAALFYDFMHRK